MSMTNYELCHVSYRGYMEKEISAACKILHRYGKSCVDAIKELRRETDMPMTECNDMLRCMWRDMELERLQAENAKLQASNEVIAEDHAALCEQNDKLRELAQRMWRLERFGCYGCHRECDAESCYASECKEAIEIEQEMRDLGIEVDE